MALDADSSASANTFGSIPPSGVPVQLAASNAALTVEPADEVDADEVTGLAIPTVAKSAAVTLRRRKAARSLLELINVILLLGCAADGAAQ